MASINLRPWRAELRAARQKQFATTVVVCLLLAAGAAYFWYDYVQRGIETQKSRNTYLTESSKKLDKKIEEIKKLREEKEELIARMKVIQDLQGKRPVIVRVFDELVRTLPDGLFYEQLSAKRSMIEIIGVAESNSRIASLMRSFEGSEWFGEPYLSSVKASEKRATMNDFKLNVPQVTPKPAGEAKK